MSTSSRNPAALADHFSESLEVFLLGIVDYKSAMYLQARFAYEIEGRNDRLGAVLICEHPPMFTIGKDGSCAQLNQTPEELRREFPVNWVERNGGTLFHAPGQLAIYPILPVTRLNFSETTFENQMANAMRAICDDQKVATAFDPQFGAFNSRAGRVAVVCREIRREISRHAAYVNVCPDMDLQRIICLSGTERRHSSLMAERSRRVTMNSVRTSAFQNLAEHFGYEMHHIYTGHPLLKRTQRPSHDLASNH